MLINLYPSILTDILLYNIIMELNLNLDKQNNDEIKLLIDDELLIRLRNIGYSYESYKIEKILSFFQNKYYYELIVNKKFLKENICEFNFLIKNLKNNEIIFESNKY